MTNQQQQKTAIVIIAILFFIFGFVTWLNGTLIPYLKLVCDLKTDGQAFLVTFAFYMSYFFLALPSAAILGKVGYKNGMSLGLLVMAVGSLLFIPAAAMRAFPLFLTGLFVQGMGLSLLQTASNPYISIVGDLESAAQRISIMGFLNKTAGALAPLILSAILLRDASGIEEKIKTAATAADKDLLLNELASRVVMPYVILTIVLVILSFLIKQSSLPNLQLEKSEDATAKDRSSVFEYPNLVLGVIALFLYVGAEVMAGDIIGSYGKSMGLSPDATKYFTTYTMFAMLIGYALSIALIPKWISQQKALEYSAYLGIILTMAAHLTTGNTAITCIAALGLANAVMWPAIFPLAINGLGRHTQRGSALLIMGIAGGAILPQIYAALAANPNIGFQKAFPFTMIPCYIFIAYYALKGYKFV